jgi:hypothetical protein
MDSQHCENSIRSRPRPRDAAGKADGFDVFRETRRGTLRGEFNARLACDLRAVISTAIWTSIWTSIRAVSTDAQGNSERRWEDCGRFLSVPQ